MEEEEYDSESTIVGDELLDANIPTLSSENTKRQVSLGGRSMEQVDWKFIWGGPRNVQEMHGCTFNLYLK